MNDYNQTRCLRPYYADPTANAAIGNVMREEKAKKKQEEQERRKNMYENLKSVIREVKRMGCKTVDFHSIPVENLTIILTALKEYK